MRENAEFALFGPVIVGFFFCLYVIFWKRIAGPLYEKHLRKWAEDHGYRLVSWKGCSYWKRPAGWKTRNAAVFCIEVTDADGRPKKGVLETVNTWKFFDHERAEVRWEN